MGKSGNQRYSYAPPDPFITPTIEERTGGSIIGSELYQHDQLIYSGPIIENIMFHISLEFEFRDKGRLTWKAYKTGPDDYDTFVAGGSRNASSPFAGAKTLQNYPVKWFPLYVLDIQEKILELIADSKYPDSVESLMARIFLSNVSNGTTWTNQTSLPEKLIVPVSEDNSEATVHTEEVTPLINIATGWAFSPSGSHVQKVIPRLGIDAKGEAFVYRGPLAVRTSDDPDKSNFQGTSKLRWPRSTVGQRRTQTGYKIEDGFVQPSEGGSIDGIDIIHMPGIESDKIDQGRPIQFRQVATEDAVLPGIAGKPDLSSGYSWFAHHPHVLQQLRYQPLMVETWDNKTEIKDYVENVFSNQTPNLPWYHSQQVEKIHFSDWGGWLIQGYGGLDASMYLKAYADPQYTNLVTDCPFSIFYPPSSSNCSCGAANTAYGIWTSASESLTWNQLTITNDLPNSGAQKVLGPKTRLILDASISLGAGTGSTGGAGWYLGIRTARIAGVNFQPFVPIMGQTVGSTNFGNIFSSSLSVNLMDAMASHYPSYSKTGVDAILAIGIFVQTQTGETEVVDAVDGPGGSFIPDTDLGCAVGTSEITCRKLYLYEPPYEGDGDPRKPPALVHGTLQAPPTYILPIST